jgi:hypothetical protein
MTKQTSISALPEHEQEAAMNEADDASARHPSIRVGGCSLHICEIEGHWQVWLNTEDADFTGLCISSRKTRQKAVGEAVRTLEAALDRLQGPP